MGAISILTKAILLCRDWLELARNEPLIWRKVDMTCHGKKFGSKYLQDIACIAVNWSAGQLEEFSAEGFVSDDLLQYLADRLNTIYIEFPEYDDIDKKDSIAKCIGKTMHNLCSLQLIGSRLTMEGLHAILEGCTKLESLDVRNCYQLTIDQSIQSELERLKNLRLPDESTDDYKFAHHVYTLFCTCCDWSERFFSESDNDNSNVNDKHSDYDCDSDSESDSENYFNIKDEQIMFHDWVLREKRGGI
ncbi:RNI-like superfamily protein [Rhynchospora pubera]|uniref:RNI-like superfamily protein n=1 Tax=Rhynchospora pubera TaxID=906938 RepID=A0AAV8D6J7_9POAL|nr:RNI-like superfamily protein [Rhynchospora pubera]